MKIKALEWKNKRDIIFESNGPKFSYLVVFDHAIGKWSAHAELTDYSWDKEAVREIHSTVEEGKRFCQQHHEKELMRWLEAER